MYEEDKGRLLQQVADLTEQNNKLLRKLVRAQHWATFWSIMRWLIIIGATFGTYYYIQPYLETLLKNYNDLQATLKITGQNLPSLPTMPNLPKWPF
jgi:predicted MFS family arabinose efflux permease